MTVTCHLSFVTCLGFEVTLGFSQRLRVLLDLLLLAPRLGILIAFQLLLELLIDVVLFRAELNRLARPFLRVLEIPLFGIARSQRAQDVGLLILRQLAGLCSQLNRSIGVANVILWRR